VLCKRQRGLSAAQSVSNQLSPARARKDASQGSGKCARKTTGASLTQYCWALWSQGSSMRETPTILFLGFAAVAVHGILRGTEKRFNLEEALTDRFHHADLFTPLPGKYTRPSAVAAMVAHRASSRRNRGRAKLLRFWIELDEWCSASLPIRCTKPGRPA